jgi:serine/threonine protein kinase
MDQTEKEMSVVQQFGGYMFLKKFAVGGMAELYKAKKSGEKGFEKMFAVKKILPHLAMNDEFIGMLIDEAKVAALLDHPNIVRIYDLGKVEDSYCIVMEYVRGRDLRKVLNRAAKLNMPIPTAEACLIAASVLAGLSAAHTKKFKGKELDIVHRDISPQNILVSFDGEVKIADFGIAKAANQSTETKAGVLKGKVSYMSPEQARGLPLDRRSDIFSAGVILYEMLTGQKLFQGESDMVTIKKVWAARVDQLPSSLNPAVPKGLDDILQKALFRNPAGRYQTAAEMERELHRLMRAEGYTADSYSLGGYVSGMFKTEYEAELIDDEELFEACSPEEIIAGNVINDGPTHAAAMTEPPAPVSKVLQSGRYKTPGWVYGAVAVLLLLIAVQLFSSQIKTARTAEVSQALPAAQAAVPMPKKSVQKMDPAFAPANGVQAGAKASITSDPSGAAVYVDGSFAGNSPVSVFNLKVMHAYSVKVVKEGYEDWSGTLLAADVKGAGSLKADLKRNKAPILKKDDMWSDPFPKSPRNPN